MTPLRVAVVGGGIGGLVLALALRERGIGCEVYEQADELREIGAAVALSANGTRELRRLRLGEQVEAVSVVPSALVIRRGTPARSSPTTRSAVTASTRRRSVRRTTASTAWPC